MQDLPTLNDRCLALPAKLPYAAFALPVPRGGGVGKGCLRDYHGR